MELVVNSESLTNIKSAELEGFLKKERPKLFGFIKKQLPSLDDAEDVLQDVLSDYTHTILNSGPIEQTTGWLYRVARNRIADLFRKKKPDNFSELWHDDESSWLENLMIPEQNAEDQLWNDAVAKSIQAALNKLPIEQKIVFVQHEIDGLPFKKISQKTGVPIPTLISRKRYAVKALQTNLRLLYQDLTDK